MARNHSTDPATYPDEYVNDSGYLTLTEDVKDAITVRTPSDVDESFDSHQRRDHEAIHEPTEFTETYTTADFARGMARPALVDAARRQLVRDHPEILAYHNDANDETPVLYTRDTDESATPLFCVPCAFKHIRTPDSAFPSEVTPLYPSDLTEFDTASCARCERHILTDSDPEPVTDGLGEDVDERPEGVDPDEWDRYQARRDLFTCPECGELADAAVGVNSPEPIGKTHIAKSWVEIHTHDDGGPMGDTVVYYHVSEDDVDRGRELRELLADDGPTETIPDEPRTDPRETDESDPDLGQIRDPRHRPDGNGRSHSVEGVGEDTAVYCPESDRTFGPGGDTEGMAFCPYCGDPSNIGDHDAETEPGEVFCPNTGMSTYRYCPDCGTPLDVDESGLYGKYHVTEDGEPVEDCFVLEPSDDPAARAALAAYADATEDEELERDIRNWLESLDSSAMADGGADVLEPSQTWIKKANRNVEKWGLQSLDELILAMGEEMGEFAGEVHRFADYPSASGEDARMAEQGRDLIRRMDQLGRDIRDYLETVSEVEGDPFPEDERPTYLNPFPADLKQSRRKRLIRSELDDLMALGYQASWALENAPREPDEGEDDGGSFQYEPTECRECGEIVVVTRNPDAEHADEDPKFECACSTASLGSTKPDAWTGGEFL